MSKPTVTEFIRSLSVADLSTAFSEACGWPNAGRPELLIEREIEKQRIRLPQNVQSIEPADITGFGAGIHEAWAHHVRHEWVAQPFFSWCESVRAHLEDIGVDGIWAEWKHFRVAQTASRIGFGAGGANSSGSGKWTARVRDNPLIPPELLFRFCWPPLELSYPLADETAELYERFGLKRLAANVGETLDPETHDWATGGLRSLENLAASLLIRAHENDSSQSQ